MMEKYMGIEVSHGFILLEKGAKELWGNLIFLKHRYGKDFFNV